MTRLIALLPLACAACTADEPSAKGTGSSSSTSSGAPTHDDSDCFADRADAGRSDQGIAYEDELPSGACAASDSCVAEVGTRCCTPGLAAGTHQVRCTCADGAWSCVADGPAGASMCPSCTGDAGK